MILEKFKRDNPVIVEIVDETGDDNGYWLYLAPEFINPNLETGFYHERTVRKVIAAFRVHPPIPRD